MRPTTLCFVRKNDDILLGKKKRGFGIDKFNGFGGKRQDGETFRQCAVRELFEEVSLVAREEDFEAVGLMDFQFPYSPELNHLSYVYMLSTYEGLPLESEEMSPDWFSIHEIPYHSMWDGDAEWLPPLWAGKKIKGILQFEADNSTVHSIRIEEVEKVLESEDTEELYRWIDMNG